MARAARTEAKGCATAQPVGDTEREIAELLGNVRAEIGAANGDHGIDEHAQRRSLEGDLDPCCVPLVADEQVRLRETPRVARTRDGYSEMGVTRTSAILNRGEEPRLDDLEERAVRARPQLDTARNRTRCPGCSSAGGSRATSHSTMSVRPMMCHPPAVADG
jgi:hypothetical protein